MLPESQIPKDFQTSLTKITYTTRFGINFYFCKFLIDEIDSVILISISFDESVNEVTLTCQMDIGVLLEQF